MIRMPMLTEWLRVMKPMEWLMLMMHMEWYFDDDANGAANGGVADGMDHVDDADGMIEGDDADGMIEGDDADGMGHVGNADGKACGVGVGDEEFRVSLSSTKMSSLYSREMTTF